MIMANADAGKNKTSNVAIKSLSKSLSLNLRSSLSRLKVRRQSFGLSGVQGVKPVERTSLYGADFKRPPLVYLPTYQLEPRNKFNLELVTKVVEETIDEKFTGNTYHAQESPLLAMELAANVMRKVKDMCFERYRIIAVVTLGQKRAQSYNNTVAFCWDHERDRYVDVHRETTTTFIQVTLFGVYLD